MSIIACVVVKVYYSGFRLMWTPVNVGSRLMWTFHEERNRLYVTCTKLLRLIWANIRLLWATQCQARVTTIRFTHVVHVYKFIISNANESRVVCLVLAFALRKTSSAHIFMAAWYASLTPWSTKYRCNSCTERLGGCCMGCFRYFLIRKRLFFDMLQLSCECTVHVLLYVHE